MQVADSRSKYILVMHPTLGRAQHEGEVLGIKISSAIHQFCICELVRLQSHHYKTPLGAPVSLNVCCCNLLREVENSRRGFNQSQGVVILLAESRSHSSHS